MISESPFAAVFGAAVPGGEDSLVHVARYAIRMGFAVVPCLPGTKKPLCTLPSVAVKKADLAAQEEARAAGRRRWELVRHTCGVHHAMTDEKESDRVIRRLVKQYAPDPINIGIELGRSRVIVVDVDTDSERLGFEASWREATDGAMPPMTVLSPGVQDGPHGEWLHKNGGHYWFTLPEGWELPASDGAMKDESGWIAMWANRQVLVPPSIRREGPYQLVGDPTPAPVWLLKRILDHLDERLQRANRQEAKRLERAESDSEAHIDGWSTATSWASLLEPEGWYATTLPDNCGCEIWTAPGVHASPKSATAHDVGCALYDDSPGHAPLHVWTDNPPEFLIGESKTLTKIQYVALRDHGGNMPAACRAEGISREGGPDLVPLPAAGTLFRGPVDTAQFTGAGTSDAEAAENGIYPTLEAAEASVASEEPNPGGLTPLPAVDTNGLTAGQRGTHAPPPPPIGELPAAAVVPPKDPFEELVHTEKQRLLARAKAEHEIQQEHGADLYANEVERQARYTKARRDGMLALDREEAGEDGIEPGSSWAPADLTDILAGTRERPVPSLGLARTDELTLLYPGKEHLIMGEMESGKSWFASGSVAAVLAAGLPVIYLHFEETDPDGTVEKLVALGVEPEVLKELFVFVAPDEAVTPAYLRPLTARNPALVILDGVNEAMSLHGLGIREEDGAAAYRRRLVKPFTRIGAAVLSCDHVVKSKESRGRSPLGSVHKGNGIDGSMILLENSEPFGRGQLGKTRVFITKDRPGHLRAHGTPSLDEIPGKTYMGALLLDDTGTTERFTGPEAGPVLTFRAPGAPMAARPSVPLPADVPTMEGMGDIAGLFIQRFGDDALGGWTKAELKTELLVGAKTVQDKKRIRNQVDRCFSKLRGSGFIVACEENTTNRENGKHQWASPLDIATRNRGLEPLATTEDDHA